MSEHKKRKNVPLLHGAAIGALAGGIGTIVTQPLDTYAIAAQTGELPKLKKLIKQKGIRKALYSGMGSRLLKGGLAMGATLGASTALTNAYLNKYGAAYVPNIARDLKLSNVPKTVVKKVVKLNKAPKSRWTPLNATSRYAWSSLDNKSKRTIDMLIKQFVPKVRNHNKNVAVNMLSKGNDINKIKKRIGALLIKSNNTPLF